MSNPFNIFGFMRSQLEIEFGNLWDSLFPDITLETEYKFDDKRRFRLDFAHPLAKVGIEIQGQIWVVGAHSSGRGLQRDFEKARLLASLDWLYFPLSEGDICEVNLQTIAETILRR
jgi:hypothetical protein